MAVYTSVHETVAKDFFGAGSVSAIRMKVAGSVLAGAGSFIGAYYSYLDAEAADRQQELAADILLSTKAFVTASAGGAQFLTALAYSSPIIERSLGRNSLTLGLRGMKAGLEAAAATEGGAVVASQAMKRLGVWILRLGGWQVALALLVIEVLIWVISPNDLEKWCMNNAFGTNAGHGKGERTFGGEPYSTPREQKQAFDKAIGSVTLRVR
ncbi:TPA: hypothetical protein ACKP39_003663 [Stenotrophomonas maltophilia]